MATRGDNCVKRDVCTFYGCGSTSNLCADCGHYLAEAVNTSTNARIMQILKDVKECELKVLPWECTSDTVKRYQDILNKLYELVVQNQHNA